MIICRHCRGKTGRHYDHNCDGMIVGYAVVTRCGCACNEITKYQMQRMMEKPLFSLWGGPPS